MKVLFKRIRNFFIVVFSVVGVLGVIWGVYNAMHSSLFQLQVVEVSEDRDDSQVMIPLNGEDIQRMAQVPVGGASLLGLDLEAISERLENNPWIKTATLEKRFPQTLAITVVYHRPVALFQIGEKLIYIDENGEEFGDFSLRQHANLPLIQLNLENISSRDIENIKPRLLKFLDQWRRYEMFGQFKLSTINIETPNQMFLTVYFQNKDSKVLRTRIVLSQKIVRSFKSAIPRLEKIFEYLRQKSQEPEYIAFHSDKKIVVKTRIGS